MRFGDATSLVWLSSSSIQARQKGSGEQEGIKRVVKALKDVIHATDDSSVKILLENTAGQGTSIGYKFEHLRQIMDGVDSGADLRLL